MEREIITMTAIKSFTDLPQSKKLTEFLSHESADMYYCYGMNIHTKEWSFDETPTIIDNSNRIDFHADIPCWSLTALIGVLPDGTDIIKDKADTENEKYMCTAGINDDILSTFANNPVDACVAMIENLHELKLL